MQVSFSIKHRRRRKWQLWFSEYMTWSLPYTSWFHDKGNTKSIDHCSEQLENCDFLLQSIFSMNEEVVGFKIQFSFYCQNQSSESRDCKIVVNWPNCPCQGNCVALVRLFLGPLAVSISWITREIWWSIISAYL